MIAAFTETAIPSPPWIDQAAFWNQPLATALTDFGSSAEGLVSAEAERRLQRYGPNDATAPRRPNPVVRFMGRFGNPLVIILLVASALSAATGDVATFAIVSTIVLLSVLLDFVQETRAQSAVDALQQKVALRTHVWLSGSATLLVCRTGRATSLGMLAGTLIAKPPRNAFETGLHRFSGLILRITVVLVLLVMAESLMFHRPWLDSLMFALALAVGLTPELLPMIVTVTLARGAVRLARQRVIVKWLPAIHNLGAMDVLCTDKTGTLTEARIKLMRHLGPMGQESEHVLNLPS